MNFGFSQLFKKVEKKLIRTFCECKTGIQTTGIGESRKIDFNTGESKGIL
jgi:hypothetical protein